MPPLSCVDARSCGDRRHRWWLPTGVVLSATYEAKARGTVRHVVDRGEASGTARHLRGSRLRQLQRGVQGDRGCLPISASVVESASIDEAFLDLTGAVRMFGSPVQIGEYVRAVVADEQQITCSVGIGPTKFVAKVASRAAKPDGLIEVAPDEVAAYPLPVEAMWGVGNATAQKLHRLGIYTVGDLANTPRGSCVRPSARMQAACSASWRGGGTVAASPHWAGAQRCQETFRRDTDDPETVRRELLGWRTARLTGCGNSKWWAAHHHLGAVRRLH